MPPFPGNKLPGYDHSFPTGQTNRLPTASASQATQCSTGGDLFAVSPIRPFAVSSPLPDQPPELLFIHNLHVKRTRLLQLAPGLVAR
jgi:hypothetical protein